MPDTILIVDSNIFELQLKEHAVQARLNYRTIKASSVEFALDWLATEKQPRPDAALIDLATLGEPGFKAISDIKIIRPDLTIIAFLQCGDDDVAAKVLKAGAHDFLCKPLALSRLKLTLQHALRIQRMQAQLAWLERKMTERLDGNAPPVLNDYQRAAASAAKLAIMNEQGALKTLRTMEEEMICFVLHHVDGCMSRAAKSLGIGRSTLYRKISELPLGVYNSRANQTTRPIISVSSSRTS